MSCGHDHDSNQNSECEPQPEESNSDIGGHWGSSAKENEGRTPESMKEEERGGSDSIGNAVKGEGGERLEK